jgi:hypothetical protein
MTTRLLARVLYAGFGITYLVAGLGVCLLGTGLLPDAALAVIRDVARGCRTPST